MFISHTPALIAAVSVLAVGTGTATVSRTGPAGRTHTRTLAVSCRAGDGRYTVVSTVRHAKRGRSVVLTVPGYAGAGSYSASVLITRHTAHSFSERTVSHVPVTLTADGGRLSYSKTLTGKRRPKLTGRTVSATASWTCSL